MSTEHERGVASERPIEEQLRPALDEVAVARVWRGIRGHGAGERRAHDRTPWVWAGAIALAMSGVTIWIFAGGRQSAPGALCVARDGTPLAAVLRPSATPIALDDGSQLVVSAATEMEVLANDGARFITLLHRGCCHFTVKPRGPRRWTIETDLATVEVVGTEFTVQRGPRGLEVSVDHGVVLVRGEHVPGRVTRLRAGERLVVPVPSNAPTAVTAAQVDAVQIARSRDVQRPPDDSARPIVRPTAAHPAHTSDGTTTIDPDARLAEADSARAAGHFETAAQILAEVMRDNPSEPRGALAAFSLAKLQLDPLGRPADAAETFGWVVSRGSPRALIEDAQARRVEALVRAGRRAEAVAEARVYESRWPEGRRLAEVRAFVSE